MEKIVRNPTENIYPATDDYVHAMEVREVKRWLFTAGTMGLRNDGSTPRDLDEQLKLLWANIGVILAAADMTFDNIVRLTSYLRDSSYAEQNAKARTLALGERRVPTIAIVAETLLEDWLVEIEVVAAA